MIIIHGTRFFGKVDDVPGVFHVATRFMHLWYIPLIPVGSWLVLSKEKGGIRGVKIPMSGKSVFLAWLRAFLIFNAFACAVGAISMAGGRRPHMPDAIVLGASALLTAGATVATWRLPMFVRASHHRAAKLVEQAKLPEEVMVMVDVALGRLTKEDGRLLLAELTAARAGAAEVTATAADR